MTVLFCLNLIAGAALMVHAVCVINNMSKKTNHIIRLAYILLAVGALGIVMGPLYSKSIPVVAEVIIKIGAALVLIFGAYRRHKKGWVQ